MIEPSAIAIRAYTERPGRTPIAARRSGYGIDEPSDWTLTFDCETTVDAAQGLRLGVYQVRKGRSLVEEGLFIAPEALDAEELARIAAWTKETGLRCRDHADFIENAFFRYAYERRASVVGFNLPFDISRIAIRHSEARGSMRGGFTFELSPHNWRPNVRVKHLSRRSSLIDFAKPGKQETPRSSRKRGVPTPAHRGYFVDISTLASALFSKSFTLASLCEHLSTETRKLDVEAHGGRITSDYLDYTRTDVQATWECFEALKAEYAKHRLRTPIHRIISEASIGKAYMKEMGIEPLLKRRPSFPRALFGKIMGAYYGGRAEVRWRREIKRVLYCDFKSMYPTVNALMGLWRFVIASDVTWWDGTEEVRRLLRDADTKLFQDAQAWKALTAIVRVRPDRDLFPVRAAYDGVNYTIGLNYLTYKPGLWMTLADCLVAKIPSGKSPEIEEALIFEPGQAQEGLRPIDLFGDPSFRIDPLKDDAFKRLVDLRDEAKRRGDPRQLAIKIIANATSYGVFIEIIRDDAPKKELISVYGLDGERNDIGHKAIEEPGRFFNPLLGVLITGAARLMLALAERQVLDAGLDWAFCDTDSIAIVKPDEMSDAEFTERTAGVIEWFSSLNP